MAAAQQDLELRFEGVLEKAGKRFFEGYRKRWFYLEGKDLSYYKAPERTSENLLGIIDLSRVKAVNPVKAINNGFQIVTGNRTYHLSAPTPELMTDWVSVLRQAMQLQSFSSRRAKQSALTQRDEAGYDEIQSHPSRTDSGYSEISQPSFDEDDMYDSVHEATTSPGNGPDESSKRKTGGAQHPGTPIGTYEVIGSIRRGTAQPHEPEVGGYGLVGGSVNVQNNDPPLYEFVADAKPVSEYQQNKVPGHGSLNDDAVDTSGECTYDTVGSKLVSHNIDLVVGPIGDVKLGTINGDPDEPHVYRDPKVPKSLSLICESDTEEDDEIEVSMATEGTSENPLPPPVGEVYAADRIKILLKDIEGEAEEEFDSQLPPKIVEPELNAIVPASCELAFTKLKEFLAQLDEAGR